ncbi:MAG: hypothetical protein KAS32_12460 [Candidatus Peribacteraceae bacterium]|nr:hypothetical protein [Candidatus Peribacteraceae bacterium]
MILYYNKEGKPIEDTLEWVKLFEDKDYCRVQLDTVGKYRISTVWLGLDHRMIGEGDPLIFETMVFSDDDDGGEMERYSTLQSAIAGHHRMLDKYKE